MKLYISRKVHMPRISELFINIYFINFSSATVYFFIILGTIILITSYYLSNYIYISLTNCQIHKRRDMLLKNLVEVKHKVV